MSARAHHIRGLISSRACACPAAAAAATAAPGFMARCLCGVDVLVQLLQCAATAGDSHLQADLLLLLAFVVHPGHELSVTTGDVTSLLGVVIGAWRGGGVGQGGSAEHPRTHCTDAWTSAAAPRAFHPRRAPTHHSPDRSRRSSRAAQCGGSCLHRRRSCARARRSHSQAAARGGRGCARRRRSCWRPWQREWVCTRVDMPSSIAQRAAPSCPPPLPPSGEELTR
jgi:hypothetical protein